MKSFCIGSEVHEDACRAILRESSMGKNIRLSLRREPSFFLAEKIANRWSQPIILYDDECGQVLGFGVRSGRPYWLCGAPVELGYMSQLRLVPEFQNGLYLAKAYRKLKELHEQDGRVPFYLTTVFSENTKARRALEGGRGGLPLYTPIGELSSYFFTAQKARGSLDGELSIDAVVNTLERYNKEVCDYSLATRYDTYTTSWLSLVEHDAIMVQGEAFVASAVLVDFSKVKQIVIDGYSIPYKIITALARVSAPFIGMRSPPKAGSELKALYLIATSVAGNRDKGFQALLHHARHMAFQKNCHGVVCGLSLSSVLVPYADRHAMSNTKSVLYAVAWDESVIPAIDNGVDKINIEVATL